MPRLLLSWFIVPLPLLISLSASVSGELTLINLLDVIRTGGGTTQTAAYMLKRCGALHITIKAMNETLDSVELAESVAMYGDQAEEFLLSASVISGTRFEHLEAEITALTTAYQRAMSQNYLETGRFLTWDTEVDLSVCNKMAEDTGMIGHP